MHMMLMSNTPSGAFIEQHRIESIRQHQRKRLPFSGVKPICVNLSSEITNSAYFRIAETKFQQLMRARLRARHPANPSSLRFARFLSI